MEQALGAKLFERSRSRVTPTPIGIEVLAKARHLVDGATELKRTVDRLAHAENGTVTIGVGPAMAETYVAEAIALMLEQRPNSQVLVRVDHWQQLSEWLLAEELDFYVADVGEARIDRRFAYSSLPPQSFAWFCRSSHPLARRRRKRVSRREMLKYPIATPKMPPWATEWFAADLGEQGAAGLPRPFPAIECESYSMLKRLVAASNCISAALERTLTKELADGVLAVLPVDAPELTTRSGIIHLPTRELSALASELVTCIERVANAAYES